MWFYAGETASFAFDFVVDGEFVIPTSASYTIRNHTGVAVGGASLTPTGTTVTISIADTLNIIAADALFENRFVVVSFIYKGQTHTTSCTYSLTRFVPLTVGPDDVRRLTGLTRQELPDDDIDIQTAYFQLFDSFGSTFAEALTSTTFRARQANESVALQAAIDVVVSFPLRVPVLTKSEDSQFNRMASIDFAALERELRRKLQQNLTQVISTVTEATVSVFSVSSPTDRFTGE